MFQPASIVTQQTSTLGITLWAYLAIHQMHTLRNILGIPPGGEFKLSRGMARPVTPKRLDFPPSLLMHAVAIS